MISQKRYINIVSGVGAGAPVAERKLTMRVVTQNGLLPPGIVMEASTPEVVASYFGAASEEYKRAKAYLGFVSKLIFSPRSISFTRWVSGAIPPMIVGDSDTKSLANLKAVTAGTLTINVGASPVLITAIDFSGAATLTDVAAALQTKLNANADIQLKNSVVTYNTNTAQFTLTGSTPGAQAGNSLSVTPTALTTDVSVLLGWGTSGTVLVAGQDADTPETAISKSAGISNNFGSFVYATPNTPMTLGEIADVASWNHAQNNMYMYSLAVPLSGLAQLFEQVKGYSGTALNVKSAVAADDYVEQCPCEILGATNFSTFGANQNYMYYQFATRNVTVKDDPTANLADKSRGNYIGVTQNAGQTLAFYQRGVLCGGSQAAVDMNIYANEMWLKSAISSSLMRLFIALGSVPANPDGAAMCLGVLQPVLNVAGNNGTFSVGKELDAVQQQYITQITGDVNAWRQVQTLGFWINIGFESYVNENTQLTEWKAVYRLVYSKGDVIRAVDGSNVAI